MGGVDAFSLQYAQQSLHAQPTTREKELAEELSGQS
jgi:hypothetical protein